MTGKYLENWGIIIKEILKAKPYYIYAPLGRIDHIHREPNCFFDRYRFFLLILCTLCLSSVFSNMITLNFTIICMTPQNGTSVCVYRFCLVYVRLLGWQEMICNRKNRSDMYHNVWHVSAIFIKLSFSLNNFTSEFDIKVGFEKWSQNGLCSVPAGVESNRARNPIFHKIIKKFTPAVEVHFPARQLSVPKVLSVQLVYVYYLLSALSL